MSPKSILAFDIDGTLTKRNTYVILPEGLSSILNALNEKGHYCIPVTGKPAAYAVRILETNNLQDKGLIAENGGVYRILGSGKISIYAESNISSIYALKESLGLERQGGGVRNIQINNTSYEAAVDPEDLSILTIFTDPIAVSHRWKYRHSIKADLMCQLLEKHIKENKWDKDLEVLPPFPDGGVQVIRKNRATGKTINKSLLPKIVKVMYKLDSYPPTAMFGDGHNDIPAMTPNTVIPLTFANAHPEVIEFVKKKNGFISQYPSPEGLGVIEGLYWLAKKNFFQSDSKYIAEIIIKQFPQML